MHYFRTISALLAIVTIAIAPDTLKAAFVVVSNATSETIRFERIVSDGKSKVESLLSGESRPFVSGKTLDIIYTSEGKPTLVKLNAYSCLLYTSPSPRDS